MVDPITAIASAKMAYEAIKKGLQIGKDIESMAGDLGRWMNAIHDVKKGHEKAKGRRFGSVEEEALETFAAKKKAEQMEEELRNFVNMTYGPSAWSQIIRIQGQLRKQRLEEERKRKQEIEEMIMWGTIISFIILFGGLIVLILAAAF